MKIPNGHHTVMPYLIVGGAARFADFIEKIFDAKKVFYEEDGEKGVKHAEMTINGSAVLFGDSTDQWPSITCSMYVYVENADETYEKAIAHGASSLMEPADQPYGRSCGIKDPFGNVWWLVSNPT